MLQLPLDLFHDSTCLTQGQSASPEAAVHHAPPPPCAPDLPAPPATALPDALLPARFAHPRASREIVFAHARVAYEFRRGQRRTISFTVGLDGLSVRVPHWTPLHEVETALRQKERWIIAKLREAHERHARLQATRIDWRPGASLPFLGESVTLALDPCQRHGSAGAILLPAQEQRSAALHIGLPQAATPEQLRDAVQAWLMRQARRLFTQRLDHFAPQLDVRWRKMSLSSAGTRWGSASADGSIRLNWRLIHFRTSLIDYVVVHELAHLREMNHSPAFWETVQAVMPDYAARRNALRTEAIPLW